MTRTGTGFRFGKVMVQPEVSAVAINSVSTTFPPASLVERAFHLPATSASEIVADATGVSGAAAVSMAGWSLAARCSDWLQLTRTAAQQRKAKRGITPSRVRDEAGTAFGFMVGRVNKCLLHSEVKETVAMTGAFPSSL